jgi:putative membrane protein
MELLLKFLLAFIALLHLWFLILEMFFWRKPLGLKTFRMSQAKADDSAVLAANQGLYNGFLAAGLIWGMLSIDGAFAIRIFFLSCVVIAGVFGALTVSRRIFYIQALPAILGLAALWVANF